MKESTNQGSKQSLLDGHECSDNAFTDDIDQRCSSPCGKTDIVIRDCDGEDYAIVEQLTVNASPTSPYTDLDRPDTKCRLSDDQCDQGPRICESDHEWISTSPMDSPSSSLHAHTQLGPTPSSCRRDVLSPGGHPRIDLNWSASASQTTSMADMGMGHSEADGEAVEKNVASAFESRGAEGGGLWSTPVPHMKIVIMVVGTR